MQNARFGQGLVFDKEIAYAGDNSAKKPPPPHARPGGSGFLLPTASAKSELLIEA